jgi:hypothetical protein
VVENERTFSGEETKGEDKPPFGKEISMDRKKPEAIHQDNENDLESTAEIIHHPSHQGPRMTSVCVSVCVCVCVTY